MPEKDPIIAAIETLGASLKKDFEIKHRFNSERETRIEESIRELKEGFPNGDPRGHREAHESLMRAAKRKEDMYGKLTQRLIEKGLWAFFLALAGLAWYGFIHTIKGN